jgi:CheY-like chemotaxis protein/anti-sigma regulatory factor (Ser/Thr protein kinase)
MILKKEEFSFSAMLEQINNMVQTQCKEKNLRYECQVIGKVDEYYFGDDMKIKQVLINILSNAVKFTEEGGILFTVEKTAQFDKHSTLRFTISDTGIGMSKEYLEKLYLPFTQEDSTTKNKYGSTGLGMAITKNIVDMMNGQIDVESEKGKGTTFTVTMTLQNVDRQIRSFGQFDPNDFKVLIVDDDKVSLEHSKMVLEEVGIDADTCETAEEVLHLMEIKSGKLQPYDLILVDWKMPETDGIELTKAIREKFNFDTTIIILTAYNWDDITKEAVDAGVDSFMSKPLFASSVLSEFERVVNNRTLKEEENYDLSGKRILIAEDVSINAEIMKMLLEKNGIESELAENGKIALDMFAASKQDYYDAILMDVRMPIMDGLEASSRIRQLDRKDAATVPIIALTANAFDEDVQRSLQAGMNAHLSKPVDPDILFKTINELIQNSKNL